MDLTGSNADVMQLLKRAQANRTTTPATKRDGAAVAAAILGVSTGSLQRSSALDDNLDDKIEQRKPAASETASTTPDEADYDNQEQLICAVRQEIERLAGSDGAAVTKSASLRKSAITNLARLLLPVGQSTLRAALDLAAVTDAGSWADSFVVAQSAPADSTSGTSVLDDRTQSCLRAAWHITFKPLLRCLNDSSESLRLASARILTGLLARDAVPAHGGGVAKAIPHLLPAILARLPSAWVIDAKQQLFFPSQGTLEALQRGRVTAATTNTASGGDHGDGSGGTTAEGSEPCRLALLHLLCACLSLLHRHGATALLQPYGHDCMMTLHGLTRDGDPDVRTAACELLADLAGGDALVDPFQQYYHHGGDGNRTDVSSGAYEGGGSDVDAAIAPFRSHARTALAVAASQPSPLDALLPARPRRTSLTIPQLLRHYATALVRSLSGADAVGGDVSGAFTTPTGPGLWHRLSRIRLTSLLTSDALVRCHDEARAGSATAGSSAILSLLGARDANVIPVAAFYGANAGGERNTVAALMTDGNAGVRAGLVTCLHHWMTCLPDRLDWWPRLLPYLLSLLGDPHPPIAAGARAVLEQVGWVHLGLLEGQEAQRLLERLQAGEDGDGQLLTSGVYERQLPQALSSGAGIACRPHIGARMFVRNHARRFLPPLLSQLASYSPFGQGHGPSGLSIGLGQAERRGHDTRHRAAVLMAIVVAHMEEGISGDVSELLPTLVEAVASSPPPPTPQQAATVTADGAGVASAEAVSYSNSSSAVAPDFTYRQWIEASVSLVGQFVAPATWVPVLTRRMGGIAASAAASDEEGACSAAAEDGTRLPAILRVLCLMTSEALPERLCAPPAAGGPALIDLLASTVTSPGVMGPAVGMIEAAMRDQADSSNRLRPSVAAAAKAPARDTAAAPLPLPPTLSRRLAVVTLQLRQLERRPDGEKEEANPAASIAEVSGGAVGRLAGAAASASSPPSSNDSPCVELCTTLATLCGCLASAQAKGGAASSATLLHSARSPIFCCLQCLLTLRGACILAERRAGYPSSSSSSSSSPVAPSASSSSASATIPFIGRQAGAPAAMAGAPWAAVFASVGAALSRIAAVLDVPTQSCSPQPSATAGRGGRQSGSGASAVGTDIPPLAVRMPSPLFERFLSCAADSLTDTPPLSSSGSSDSSHASRAQLSLPLCLLTALTSDPQLIINAIANSQQSQPLTQQLSRCLTSSYHAVIAAEMGTNIVTSGSAADDTCIQLLEAALPLLQTAHALLSAAESQTMQHGLASDPASCTATVRDLRDIASGILQRAQGVSVRASDQVGGAVAAASCSSRQ